jgi:hypothetical protein
MTYHPDHRRERFSRGPVIKDAYDWFLYQKAHMVAAAFWYTKSCQVAGDYVEFGVFEGGTFVQAWHIANQLGLPTRFHAFDSFKGLPPVTDEGDRDGPHRGGMFSESDRNAFEQNLKLNDVDMSRVTITEGFFDAVLTTERRRAIGLEAAAIVWVDCDLYASTVPALRFISDAIVDGAVLIFDDWFAFRGRPNRGEQQAFNEWLEANPQLTVTEFLTFGYLGKSFIVLRS